MFRIARRAKAGHPNYLARGLRVCTLLTLLVLAGPATSPKAQGVDLRPRLAGPVWVYNNWSAYDELSDAVPLNEPLAMRELAEMLRLRNAGVHFDYYVMDAFWYDPDGGYRIWRREDWPDGPHRWIAACQAAGVKPGLWFSSNTLTSMKPAPQWQSSLNASGTAMALYSGGFLDDFRSQAAGVKPGLWFSSNTLTSMKPAPQWQSSLNASGTAMALYSGGFLDDFMDVLQHWYERGIRMFKLDFADFTVAAKGDENRLRPQEIRLRNGRALHAALRSFRRNHPDVVLVAFNGFVGDVDSAASSLDPFNVQW